MTTKQYKEYYTMYINRIEEAGSNLPDKEYHELMENITGLVTLIGDKWRDMLDDIKK